MFSDAVEQVSEEQQAQEEVTEPETPASDNAEIQETE